MGIPFTVPVVWFLMSEWQSDLIVLQGSICVVSEEARRRSRWWSIKIWNQYYFIQGGNIFSSSLPFCKYLEIKNLSLNGKNGKYLFQS